MMVMYLHLGAFSRYVIKLLDEQIAEQLLIEAGDAKASRALDTSAMAIIDVSTKHGVAA